MQVNKYEKKTLEIFRFKKAFILRQKMAYGFFLNIAKRYFVIFIIFVF